MRFLPGKGSTFYHLVMHYLKKELHFTGKAWLTCWSFAISFGKCEKILVWVYVKLFKQPNFVHCLVGRICNVRRWECPTDTGKTEKNNWRWTEKSSSNRHIPKSKSYYTTKHNQLFWALKSAFPLFAITDKLGRFNSIYSWMFVLNLIFESS